MKPRSAKAKGSKAERDLVADILKTGCPARKQPLSGAISDFPGDVHIDPRGWDINVEVKHHKTIAGYERFEKLRELADCLVIDTPEGTWRWCGHGFILDLLERAYGDERTAKGIPTNIHEKAVQIKSNLKTFHGWIKGCDVLVVKPNHGEFCWFIPANFYYQLLQRAAMWS
jgi:hypothetical protein